MQYGENAKAASLPWADPGGSRELFFPLTKRKSAPCPCRATPTGPDARDGGNKRQG
jgi:hypothetical protein